MYMCTNHQCCRALCGSHLPSRYSQENELDKEGEVRGGVGRAQLGQLPSHEEVAGGLALVHLPRTLLAGLWRRRKEEKHVM